MALTKAAVASSLDASVSDDRSARNSSTHHSLISTTSEVSESLLSSPSDAAMVVDTAENGVGPGISGGFGMPGSSAIRRAVSASSILTTRVAVRGASSTGEDIPSTLTLASSEASPISPVILRVARESGLPLPSSPIQSQGPRALFQHPVGSNLNTPSTSSVPSATATSAAVPAAVYPGALPQHPSLLYLASTSSLQAQSLILEAEKRLVANEPNEALVMATNMISQHRDAFEQRSPFAATPTCGASTALLHPLRTPFDASSPVSTSSLLLSRAELEMAHVLCCKALVQMGAWARAYAACREALIISPQHHELLHLSGKVLLECGKPAEAVAFFGYAIDVKSDHLPSWLARGLTYHMHLKDSARAVSDFHASIVLNPTYYKSFFYMGMVMTDLGRYDLAVEAYDRSIHLNSTYSESYFRRGVLHLQHHHLEKAVEDFTTVTNMVPESAEAHYNCALALHLLKRNEAAIQSYQFCLQYQPSYVNALKNCAHAQTELGLYPDAFEKYSTALTLPNLDDDTKLDILLARGQVCERSDDFEQALTDYSHAIELRPTLGRAFSYRGLLHLARSNSNENVAPRRNVEVPNQLGEAQDQENANENRMIVSEDASAPSAFDIRDSHLNRALDDFSQALVLEPDNARAWNNHGTALLQARQFDVAIADFDRALRIWPTFTKALRNRGKALYLRGQAEEAFEALTAAAHSPNAHSDAETYILRGSVLRSLGQTTKALKDFARAQEPLRKRNSRQEQTDMLAWLQLDLPTPSYE